MEAQVGAGTGTPYHGAWAGPGNRAARASPACHRCWPYTHTASWPTLRSGWRCRACRASRCPQRPRRRPPSSSSSPRRRQGKRQRQCWQTCPPLPAPRRNCLQRWKRRQRRRSQSGCWWRPEAAAARCWCRSRRRWAVLGCTAASRCHRPVVPGRPYTPLHAATACDGAVSWLAVRSAVLNAAAQAQCFSASVKKGCEGSTGGRPSPSGIVLAWRGAATHALVGRALDTNTVR